MYKVKKYSNSELKYLFPYPRNMTILLPSKTNVTSHWVLQYLLCKLFENI
jgi:hypothetical protein